MRALLALGLAVTLALACNSEKESSKLIAASKERERDAGTVSPAPPNATVITAGQNVPRDLHQDGDSLYWVNEGRRAEGLPGVFKVSKSGGEAVTLFQGKGVQALALDDANVYWTNAENGTVMRVPKSGGSPVAVAAEQDNVAAIAVDATHVYWIAGEAIVRVEKEGGKPPKPVVEGFGQPTGLAVDDAFVYSYSTLSGKLSRVPKKGGAAKPVVTEDVTLHAFFADDRFLYWSIGSEGKAELKRLAKAGGKPSSVVTGQSIPGGLAQDGSSIYWTNGDAIFRADKSGGGATKIVDKTDRAISLAVDATNVYWTDRMGRVQKLPK